MNIDNIMINLRGFAAERKWEKYHNPKNLTMALGVEASELSEIFQWVEAGESLTMLDDKRIRESTEDEVADIFIYLLRFCDVTGIDPEKAIYRKIKKNTIKYPAEEAVKLNKFVKK